MHSLGKEYSGKADNAGEKIKSEYKKLENPLLLSIIKNQIPIYN